MDQITGLTAAILADIEAKAKAATPGPWHEHTQLNIDVPLSTDTAYILSLSPDVALAQVERIRELEAALAKCRMFIATWQDCLAGVQMTEQDFAETSGLKEASAILDG